MDVKPTVHLHTRSVMPVLGLGSWRLTKDTADAVLSALQLGYRMIDTSGDYGTQAGIGEGIRRSGVPRKDLFITTKVETTDDAYEATKKNLQELGLDYANLMLIHRPPSGGVGEELWRGLMRARQEGLTKDIGVSNYSIDQMQMLIDASGEVPVVNQIEWTPFGYSAAMFGYAQENGIVIQAYSPLTQGKRLNDEHLVELANHYGKTPAQIIIRWNLQLGTVPILRSGNPKHQQENLDVFDFEISRNDMNTLSALNEHYSAIGSLQYV